jgi:hypothetical protein
MEWARILAYITRNCFCAMSTPERKRTTTWAEFIQAHLAVLAGTDFFRVEVLSLRGLVTYYVLIFIHLGSRKVRSPGSLPTDRAMDEASGSERHFEKVTVTEIFEGDSRFPDRTI